MRSAVLVPFILLTWSVPGSAQLRVQGPAPSALFSHRQAGPLQTTAAAEPRDSLRRASRPTHWKEGAFIGGVVGAVGGAVLVNHLCGVANESTRGCTGSTVLGSVLGAALLALPGALIGKQFSKEPAEPEHPD